jgi:hypothetical protein
MNEIRFRRLMSELIGNEPPPPWLAAHVRTRLQAPPARTVPRRLIVAIAALAIVLAGALELNGMVQRSAPIIGPAATPSTSPSPRQVAIDPTNCRLPVFVERGAGPPSQLSTQVGFVDTKTGRYMRDKAATIASLPRGDGIYVDAGPIIYSFPVHHWLPTGTTGLAPDGRSYAWIRTLPAGVPYPRYTSSELHRYDVATSTDQLLWAYRGGFAIQGWDSSGILVDAGPVGRNELSWWVIDPATGAATRHPAPHHPFPPFKPLPGDPKRLQFHAMGVDAQGHTIFNIGDLDGTLEWVFYETAPGKRVTIYRSPEGNAIGFNPDELMIDSTGIWFANFDNGTIWHWQVGQRLRKVSLAGVPPPLSGANSYVHVTPAGACF